MTHNPSPETAKQNGQMKGNLDTDVGVQDFKLGWRMLDNDDCNGACGRRYGLSIGDGNMRIRRGLKTRLGRRIRLDKVLQRERLTIVLRLDGHLAGRFTAIVRGSVRSKTEQNLRAGEAVTPEQCGQQ